jgi:hypothetical protein
MSKPRVEIHGMVSHAPNVATALVPEFEEGFYSPSGWLGKEGKEAAFVVVHGSIVAQSRAASNVRFPPQPDVEG